MLGNMKVNEANDYSVALALNESAMSIFFLVDMDLILHEFEEYDPAELNRLYILLVDQLEKLYDRSPKLAEIRPEPVWKHFEVLRDSFYEIRKYLEDNNTSSQHRNRVEKLCIIAGTETPDFTPEQKKLVDDTNALHGKFSQMIIDYLEKKQEVSSDDNKSRPPRTWYIPEYTIIYKADGTILINNALKLKKVHAGSTTERLLEQVVKNPNRLFKPDIGQTSRNISTVLSGAGFTPMLRDLFFPTVSDNNGIVFRPTVTREEAIADKLDVYELDGKLHEAGAETTLLPDDVLVDLEFLTPDEPE